jgi:hypothetical protein
MNLSRPYVSPARYLLLLLPLLAVGLAAWFWGLLLDRISQGGYDFATFLCGLELFLSLVLFGMSVYLAWCAFTISYRLSADKLTLRCGGVRQVIPLAAVTDVYAPGATIHGKPITVRWAGLSDAIPGYLVGVGQSPQLGRVVSVATRPTSGQLFLQTRGTAYGLSPARSSEFAQELERRRDLQLELLDEEPKMPHTELRGPSAWASMLWADRPARIMLLAGLLISVLFFGYMSLVYSSLPASLPLHWNSQAQIDVIGDPQELLRLPAFALGIWFVNTLAAVWALRRERAASLFLLGGALAAQVVFAAGALSIVLRTS